MTERINWSTLRHMATSPKLLKYRTEHPQEDSPALRLGRAIHCLVMEPQNYASRWTAAGPCQAVKKTTGDVCGSSGSLWRDGEWYCKVRGHAPLGATPEPPDMEIITAEDEKLAKVCAEAVKRHEVAASILTGGHSEQELEWDVLGMAARGRLDYIKANAIVDLKSTRKGTVREFMQDVARHMYHGQVAWYHDGAIAAGRIPADAELPYIVAVSTIEPYDVMPFQLSKEAYQAGQILYRDLLAEYGRCQTSEMWPGVAPDLLVLELPNWAPGMMGSQEELTDEW